MIPEMRNKDWLSRALQRFTPWQAAMIFLGVNILVDVPLAFVFGALLPGPKTHGLLAERMVYTSDLLIPAVIFGYYVWIQKIPKQIFDSLVKEGIVTLDEKVDQEIEAARRILESRWVGRLALLAGIVGGISLVLSIPTSNPAYVGWMVVNPLIPLVRGILTGFTVYGAVVFLFDVAVIIRTLRRIFANQAIRVRPFHIDGAGGLGAVGKFVSSLGYLLGAFGIHVSVSLFSNTLPGGISSIGIMYFAKVGGLLVYVLIAPLLFYLPLYSGHAAMVRWRNGLLAEIERNLESEFERLRESFVTNDKPGESMTRISSLRDAYSHVSSFPVWPFGQKSVRKYFGVVTGSIVPGTISIIIDLRGLL